MPVWGFSDGLFLFLCGYAREMTLLYFYKKAFTIDEAYDILKENSGTHFEPSLVEVMLIIRSDLEKIYGKKND